MTDFLPAADTQAGILLTYLMQSTLIFMLVGIVLFCWRSARPDMRALMWKAALIAPLVTTLTTVLVGTPHVGPTFNISTELTGSTVSDTADRRHEIHTRGSGPVVIESMTVPTAPLPAVGRSANGPPPAGRITDRATAPGFPIWSLLVFGCLGGALLGCVRLSVQAIRLRALRQRSSTVTDDDIRRTVERLSQRAGLQRNIEVLESSEIAGPLTAGVLRPFILVPCRFLEVLSPQQRDGLLAHEIVHVVRRDAVWTLLGQLICQTLFFQPLNRIARRQLEMETEFVADQQAAQLLQQRSGLAACLIRLGEWLASSPPTAGRSQPLAAGMAAFRSTLGRRVETLLQNHKTSQATPQPVRPLVAVLIVAIALTAVTFAPRAVTTSAAETIPAERVGSMKQKISALAVLAGLTLPVVADNEPEEKQSTARPPVSRQTPDALPDGVQRFNGMLVGRLVKKDVEKGIFLLNVDAVSRVWRNSKATDPKSLVGKNIEIDGVSGKWLDVLLLVKPGETLECEARHDGGNRLTFPGELLRKTAPYQPEDYPVLPESFRGFQGAVAATVQKKDPETLELIVRVNRVLDTWKNNRAKQPRSIEGKSMMLGGFWRRKDTYHGIKVGDNIEVGLQHIGTRSDHLTVAEFVRQGGDGKTAGRSAANASSQTGFPDGLRRFNGMLVGRLVEKDVEKGTFVLTVDAVPRVWRNSKATNPKSIIGRNIEVDSVSGKWLDVLLLVRKGETLECEASHDGGDRLSFPGELLRKVAPVQPGDYPELPEDARGFYGSVVGKITKKDPTLAELMLQVEEVKGTGSKSRAKDPTQIVGKPVMVVGFWRHRDEYDRLKVGERIQCGLQHIQTRSDHLNVAEFRRIADDSQRD